MLDLGQVAEVVNTFLPYLRDVVGVAIGLGVILALTGAALNFLSRKS